MSFALLVICALATAGEGGNPNRSVPRVEVGDRMPRLPLLQPDGVETRLAQERKRPLVVIFGSFT